MVGVNYSAPDDAMGETRPLPRVGASPPAAPRSRFSLPGGPLLGGLGLLAVAVVASLLWWLIRHDSGPEVTAKPDPATSGEFKYERVAGPVTAQNCAENSYGEIKKWFNDHPCERLVRALYVTTTPDGARALISVALVTMPTSELAQQLKVNTDTDNTGNVADLVRDGTAKLPRAPEVAKGEYESQASGTDVTIVEGEFYERHKDDALLKRITLDALRLSEALRPAGTP